MKKYTVTNSDREIIEAALGVLRQDFGDKSHYHTVGAAVRCSSGKIYAGINCDGIHGSCAEFIAIGAAISAGEREAETIVAVHEGAPNKLVPPCGNCRQMLFEYFPEIKVILNDENSVVIKTGVKDLLPLAYVEIID